ncbi:hypothetical protein DFQ26_008915 [Actinomortierella ambigua]|nr:hypothetical protein DFQ26_008915 [Actinomortierella ambigua]
MRPFLGCLLVALLPAALFASPEPFCEEKISRTGRLFGRPAYYDLEQELPGYLHLIENEIRGGVEVPTFWSLEGKLEEKLLEYPMFLPGLMYKFNDPKDFEGPFEATFGRGEAKLEWHRSGASITGRSPIGDRKVKGEARILYA